MAANSDGRNQNHRVSEILVNKEEGDDTSSVAGGSHILNDDDGSGIHSTSSPGSTGTGKSGGSESGGGSGSSHGNEDNFHKDGGAMSGARICFLLTLLAAASALAIAVWRVTATDQTDNFSAAVSRGVSSSLLPV